MQDRAKANHDLSKDAMIIHVRDKDAMISHDLGNGTMVNHDSARLTMIMASVPWLQTLGPVH